MKWKVEGGIHYSMLQNPTSSAYVPGEDIKFFSEQDTCPNGPTGKSSDKKFETMPRGKRANKNIANMKSPFSRPSSAATRPAVQRRAGIGQGAKSGLAEVALIATSRMYLASLDNRFWEAIQDMSRDIVDGIKKHGGVLIVGRVSMMPTPNPDTGIRQTFFYDAYIKDGAKSIDELFTPTVKSDATPAFVGPQPWAGLSKTKPASMGPRETAFIGAAKYGPPKAWVPPRGYMVLGEYKVFATSTTNAKR
ncbi:MULTISPECIES: hypothetical protein [Litoreibacter]|uniref:hypothetical protein n=1 Tax=Litoreibacter TaxID=947567 RepID=UPI0010642C05|nr:MULTISPECIES: hypothetical protein [Litoreibacter]